MSVRAKRCLPPSPGLIYAAALFALASGLFAQGNEKERKNEEHKAAPARAHAAQERQPEGRGQPPQQQQHESRPANEPAGARYGASGAGAARGPQNERPPAARSGSGVTGGVTGYRPAPGTGSRSGPPAGGWGANRPASPGNYRGPAGPMVVHTANATVFRGPGDVQRIVRPMPGGRIVVSNAWGRGYVQRSVTVRGAVYVQRTFYVGGRPTALFYRPYLYHGVAFNVYVPVRFWTPRFYLWAYNPWPAPIYYNWGWGANPWFGFYAGFFAPYPRYPGAAFWLTDYIIAAQLQAAYQERLDAAAANAAATNAGAANPYYPPPQPGPDAVVNNGQVVLTPEVKQAIADEVRQQLQQEQAEATAAQTEPVAPNPPISAPQPNEPAPVAQPSNTPPPALTPNVSHVFVVSSVLVVSANGQQCAVTQGDVLQIDPAPTFPDPTSARVLASKSSDCQTGRSVQVGLADLQEMQNDMRRMLDQGLSDIQTKQGQGNMPVINASLRTQMPASYAADFPGPDPTAATALQQTAKSATPSAAPPAIQPPATGQPPTAGPATITLGQTIDQVIAIMGQPVTKFESPGKTIYVYKNLKITFAGGKVSDVQ